MQVVRSDVSRHIYLPYVPFPQSHTLMVGKFINIITKKYSLRHGRSNKVPFVGVRNYLTSTRKSFPPFYVSRLGTKLNEMDTYLSSRITIYYLPTSDCRIIATAAAADDDDDEWQR